MANTEKRVSLIGIVLLILLSACFDAVEFFLSLTVIGIVIAWFLVLIKWVIFWLILWFVYKINLTKGVLRKATIGFTALAGAVPVLNMIPEFTFGLAILLVSNYLETNYPKTAKLTEAVTRSKRKRGTPPPIPRQENNQSQVTRQRSTPPPIPNNQRSTPPPLP